MGEQDFPTHLLRQTGAPQDLMQPVVSGAVTKSQESPPILSRGVGQLVGDYSVEVSKRMVLAYAAGIGATEPRYMDDHRPEGIVAPLGFATSLEWPVIDSPEFCEAIGRSPQNAYEGLVHAFQDSRFYRPIRPGDRLRVTGRITETLSTTAGTLVVCWILTQGEAFGEPVVESWFGALYRGATLAEPPRQVEARPAMRHDADLSADGGNRSQPIPIPRALPHIYTECARIWNPIHTERHAAMADSLPDIILHGSCTWAMALQRIAGHYRNGTNLPVRRFAARFSRPVIPGNTLELTHRLTAPKSVAFVVRNPDGRLALSHGLADLR